VKLIGDKACYSDLPTPSRPRWASNRAALLLGDAMQGARLLLRVKAGNFLSVVPLACIVILFRRIRDAYQRRARVIP